MADKISQLDSATIRVQLTSNEPDAADATTVASKPELQVTATLSRDKQKPVYLHVTSSDGAQHTFKFADRSAFTAFMNDEKSAEQLGVEGAKQHRDLLARVQSAVDLAKVEFADADNGKIFAPEDAGTRAAAGLEVPTIVGRDAASASGARGLVRQVQDFLVGAGVLAPTARSNGLFDRATREAMLTYFAKNPDLYQRLLDSVTPEQRAALPTPATLSAARSNDLRSIASRDLYYPVASVAELFAQVLPSSGSSTRTARAALLAAEPITIGPNDFQKAGAFKALRANISLEGDGQVTVKDKSRFNLVQLEGAVKALFGSGASVSVEGGGTYIRGEGVPDSLLRVKALFDATEIDSEGRVSFKDGKLTADVRADVNSTFGPVALVSANRLVFNDGKFSAVELNEKAVTTFGPDASLTSSLASTVTSKGLASAEALAAFRTLLAGTELDSRGRLVVKENKVSEGQFAAAVKTLFGDNTTLAADGSFDYQRDVGIAADLKSQFTTVYKEAEISADGAIAFKDGKVSGSAAAGLTKMFGGFASVSNARVVFDNSAFSSVDLSQRFAGTFGTAGNLDSSLTSTITAKGIASAEALAAFRTLLAGTELDSRGRLVIKENKLTQAQFAAATKTLFGDKTTLAADGSFDYQRDAGISAELKSQFTTVYRETEISADGAIAFKGRMVSGSAQAGVTKMFGGFASVSNARVVFDNNAFTSAELSQRFSGKFGSASNLESSLASTITKKGLESAEALAAFRTLVAGTELDSRGRLVVKNNKLSQAQFAAATKTLFGKNATLAADGSFDYQRQSGIAADLKTRFTTVYKEAEIAADGAIAFKGGKVSGSAAAAVTKMFGGFASVSSARVLFDNNVFASAELSQRFSGKFGEAGNLDTSLVSTLTKRGIESAEALAAFRTLIAGTELDSRGRLVVKDNRISEGQLTAAVKALFGDSITLGADGSFDYQRNGGISAELKSQFSAVYKQTEIGADGAIAFKSGMVSGSAQVGVKEMFGGFASVTNGRIVFDNNAFTSAELAERFTGTFGAAGSIDASLASTITRNGVESAEALAAFRTLVASTEIDSRGLLVIRDSRFTQAQFSAAVKSVFGEGVTLAADGSFDYQRDSGISAELKSQFTAVFSETEIAADGAVTFKDGKVSGMAQVGVTKMFGGFVSVSNGRVIFDDNAFTSTELSQHFTGTFGAGGSLDASLATTLTKKGVQSAEALAAFRTLVGGTELDSRGRLVIADNKLTQAQLSAAVKTVFGQSATLAADGSFDYQRGAGIAADLKAQFTAVYGEAQIGVDGAITLKNGKVPEVKAGVTAMFGGFASVSNGTILFDNNVFASADLSQRFTGTFGSGGSLEASLTSTVTKKGIESAEALAAFRALVGSTTLDSRGRLVIEDNGLTQAQFAAAVETIFGENAKLGADGSFDYQRQGGISAELKSQFTAVYKGTEIGADGAIAFKGGRISAEAQAGVTEMFGDLVSVTNARIVFDDSAFSSLALSQSFTGTFGAAGNLESSLSTTLTKKGVASAEALAAFRTLVAGTELDTSGRLVIADNKLTGLQFRAATKTLFGDSATLGADGSFDLDGAAGVSAELKSQFKAVYTSAEIATDGAIAFKNGQVSGEAKASVTKMFGGLASVTDGHIVFDDAAFREADVSQCFTREFGAAGSLTASVSGHITPQGIDEVNVFAASKRLIGALEVGTDGSVRIKDKRVDEVTAALSLLAGTDVTVKNGVVVGFAKTGRFAEATFRNAVLLTSTRGRVETDGSLRLRADGMNESEVKATVERVFGSAAQVKASASGDAKIVFDSRGARLEQVTGAVSTAFGPVNLDANIAYDGAITGTIALGAFKTLKHLANDGHIDLKNDGSVVIKDGRIDRAELSALLSTVAGDQVDIASDGKVVWANGKLGGDLTAKIKAAVDGTTLDASGTLRVVDGKPEVEANIKAMFEGSSISAGGTLAMRSVDSFDLGFALKTKGENTHLDASGNLEIEDWKFRGASLSTTLVSTGTDTNNMSLSGTLVVNDKDLEASLKAQVNAGVLDVGVDFAIASTVTPYIPAAEDDIRQRAVQDGGFWSERTLSMRGGGKLGIKVQAGTIPVRVGFGVEGAKEESVRVLSIHPTEEDASKRAPLTALHLPTSASEYLKMRPGETVSRKGTGTLGVSGSVAIGYGLGPAEVSIGGDVYNRMTGDMQLEVVRLEGNKVAVKIKRGQQKLEGASIGLTVGLRGEALPNIPGIGALNDKVKPIVSQLAQASFKQAWEKLGSDESAFDLEFDLSNPAALAAFERAVSLDLSESQAMASYTDSGVTLRSSIHTGVSAELSRTNVQLPGLTYERLSQWVKQVSDVVTEKRIATHETDLRYLRRDPLLPWHANAEMSTYFVHKMDIPRVQTKLPQGATVTAAGAFIIRQAQTVSGLQPRLRDVQSFLKFNLTLDDPFTSRGDVKERVSPLVGAMEFLGLLPEEYSQLKNLEDAGNKIPPDKKALLLFLGDNTYGRTRLKLDGFVAPRGMIEIFRRPMTQAEQAAAAAKGGTTRGNTWRTREEFVATYLDAEEALSGPSLPIYSKEWLLCEMGRTTGCAVVTSKVGDKVTHKLVRRDKTIGQFSDAELAALQHKVIAGPDSGQKVTADGLGNWTEKPALLLDIDESDVSMSRDVLKRARSFGDALNQISTLFRNNVAPAQRPGESDEAYRARLAQLGILAPDVYYDKVEAIFREMESKQDWQMSAPLALLKLAPPSRRALSAKVDLPEEAVRAMINKGRAKIQQYAAFSLLAGRSKSAGGGLVVDVPPAQDSVVSKAAQILFGKDVAVTRQADGLHIDKLGIKSGDEGTGKRALVELITKVRRQDGKLMLPSDWDWKRRQALVDEALGRDVGVSSGGDVVFDNRGLDKVHLGDALDAAFGGEPIEGFRTFNPVPPQGDHQVWDASWDYDLTYTGSQFNRGDLDFLKSEEISAQNVAQNTLGGEDTTKGMLTTDNRYASKGVQRLNYAVEARDWVLMQEVLHGFEARLKVTPPAVSTEEVKDLINELGDAKAAADKANKWSILEIILGILALGIPFIVDACTTEEYERAQKLIKELRARAAAAAASASSSAGASGETGASSAPSASTADSSASGSPAANTAGTTSEASRARANVTASR